MPFVDIYLNAYEQEFLKDTRWLPSETSVRIFHTLQNYRFESCCSLRDGSKESAATATCIHQIFYYSSTDKPK
jgi:hypothetical protein